MPSQVRPTTTSRDIVATSTTRGTGAGGQFGRRKDDTNNPANSPRKLTPQSLQRTCGVLTTLSVTDSTNTKTTAKCPAIGQTKSGELSAKYLRVRALLNMEKVQLGGLQWIRRIEMIGRSDGIGLWEWSGLRKWR